MPGFTAFACYFAKIHVPRRLLGRPGCGGAVLRRGGPARRRHSEKLRLADLEVRILDDPKHIPEGVLDRGNPNAAPYVLHAAVLFRTQFE